MVLSAANSNMKELQIFNFYGCTFWCNIEGEMLPGIDSVQNYTGRGGDSDLLVAFAHNSANLLYLAHAESHAGLAVALLHVHVFYDYTGAFFSV